MDAEHRHLDRIEWHPRPDDPPGPATSAEDSPPRRYLRARRHEYPEATDRYLRHLRA